MSWVRIDDGFATHPKIAELSDRAFRAHVEALCYCAQHLTDGVIRARTVARTWHAKVVDELEQAGLWAECEGGYAIHDYLEYNRSREVVLAERTASRERQERFRNTVRNGVTDTVTNAAGNGVRNAVSAASPTRPVLPTEVLRARRGAWNQDPPPSKPVRYFRGNCPDCRQELHQSGTGPITGHEAGCQKAVAK